MFSCEAEEIDEEKGRDSYEEERSTACRHSLLDKKVAREIENVMRCTRSYIDIMRSR